jgi:hypothetical protein
MSDLSKLSLAELQARLNALKEKKKTGSSLSVNEIRNAQKRINKQKTKIPSNLSRMMGSIK